MLLLAGAAPSNLSRLEKGGKKGREIKFLVNILQEKVQSMTSPQLIYSHQGTKTIQFSSLPEAVIILEVIFPSPKKINFLNKNVTQNFHLPIGKCRVKSTSPTAKSTSPGLSDVNFFVFNAPIRQYSTRTDSRQLY